MELGGNIELVGFRDLDAAKLIVVKKVVGNYVRKLGNETDNLEKLSITMKMVGNEQKTELHGKLIDNGTVITSEATDMNLFYALDGVLKGILAQMKKK